MNWFKQNLEKLMFWKDGPSASMGDLPDVPITDCWPTLPDDADQAAPDTTPPSD